MSNKKEKKSLFAEFSSISTKEWEEKINKELKGADYNKLIWKTTEGINVKPYYRAEDIEDLAHLNVNPGEFPYVRGNKKIDNSWEIRQNIDEVESEKANSIANKALLGGVEALGFNAKEIDSPEMMKALLQGIDLTKVSIHFTSATSYNDICDLFIREIKRQGIDSKKIKGSFNFDSLSYFLLYGKFYPSQDNNFEEAKSLLSKVTEKIPLFKVITVNGQYFHNAGASIVQELAFSLASANEYIAKLTDKGVSIDDIAPSIQFVFATGSNYFLEIAKLRAVRMLWAKIVEQYKPKKEESMMMYIHVVTSLWNKSVYDAYVNMLRNTTEAMSSVIGGCNSMTVTPFDNTYKKPDEFAERIARNTQLILKAESSLDKVIDPSAGSYYIECITDSIADVVWKLFLEIEEKGGFIKAVETGFIKEEIEKTCQKRDMDIAMRKQVILGTNQYPNLKEKMLDKITPNFDVSQLGNIKLYRGAQAFEALRLATEAYEKDGHKKPSVFLLSYGNPAMSKARAAFTTNFFGCSGYDIIDNGIYKSIDEGVVASLKSYAEIIVFCSSDEEYAGNVALACEKIKQQNSEVFVIVAGNPTEIIEELKQSGVDDFIHMRSNIISTLHKYQSLFGII